jgi:hypothetical protein
MLKLTRRTTSPRRLAELVLDQGSGRRPDSGHPGSRWNYVTANQGTYDTYMQAFEPVIQMVGRKKYVSVRRYVDEILIPKLKLGLRLKARVFVWGTNISIPMQFVRVQPYVSPKIEFSDQRLERVDVCVPPGDISLQQMLPHTLPLIYRQFQTSRAVLLS